MLNRRGLITGLISLVAAPAIIRVNHLMPISVPKLELLPGNYDVVIVDSLYEHQRIIFDLVIKQKVFNNKYKVNLTHIE